MEKGPWQCCSRTAGEMDPDIEFTFNGWERWFGTHWKWASILGGQKKSGPWLKQNPCTKKHENWNKSGDTKSQKLCKAKKVVRLQLCSGILQVPNSIHTPISSGEPDKQIIKKTAGIAQRVYITILDTKPSNHQRDRTSPCPVRQRWRLRQCLRAAVSWSATEHPSRQIKHGEKKIHDLFFLVKPKNWENWKSTRVGFEILGFSSRQIFASAFFGAQRFGHLAIHMHTSTHLRVESTWVMYISPSISSLSSVAIQRCSSFSTALSRITGLPQPLSGSKNLSSHLANSL